MKVRVTFEITDEERIVLGVKAANQLRPATREEAVATLTELAMEPVRAGAAALAEANRRTLQTIQPEPAKIVNESVTEG